MRSTRAGCILVLAVSVLARTVHAADEPPVLRADSGRTVDDSLGGGGQALTIASAILGETRRVGLVLPPSFARSAPDRRYPVTIVLDGEVNLAPTAAVVDELSKHGLVPESVVVAIENVDPVRGRLRDLTPPGLSVSGSSRDEGGDRFLDFIERELLPAIDRQFRGGSPRVLVGHSSGGILATYAAATRPAFRAVVAIDTPMHLGDGWLAKRLTARASASPPPLRYAAYEARFPWPDAAWKDLVAAAPPTWKLHREKLEGEGHETVFLLAAYLGIREVFRDYSRLSAPIAPTTSILPHYSGVGDALGARLVPPARVLGDVVDDLLMEGRGALAREAYGLLAFGYGEPADGAETLARIAEVERRPPPAESVESLLAAPFPTPDEAAPFVGDWVGDLWMSPDEPRTGSTVLRIRVVDGRVVGETVHRGGPNGELVQRWEVMRITPAGLTWGYMNGMRPRGVLLFEGSLVDQRLSGERRFGGIDFRPPEGLPDDSVHFSFEHVRR